MIRSKPQLAALPAAARPAVVAGDHDAPAPEARASSSVKLEFAGTEDAYLSTVFLVDDIAIG
ncbi:hypothetical protein OG481_27435 [Streptomyces longwoodensis]|uniref:hypothetical protein n=1 Tax=Streptomyces longwoodensis TaxID=68231 RepID=UPI0022597AB6|nr:hypothetical protein [Streptomyces longwoodensis]MCX4997380.1 hypothetical protein [Streptomyces longwoodensis]WRY92008.1 hypothetical protein OG481_27435 [Streptomyces longwoodensis]WUC70003.1 hypothetical protein OG416_03895 [Streptomyces longwoodensis]